MLTISSFEGSVEEARDTTVRETPPNSRHWVVSLSVDNFIFVVSGDMNESLWLITTMWQLQVKGSLPGIVKFVSVIILNVRLIPRNLIYLFII